MSRKPRQYKRAHKPDPIHKSVKLARFINKVMIDGKKSVAERIVYKALDELAKSSNKPALESFETVLKNATPLMEVKSRRVGGSTYQVPIEVKKNRGMALAIRWIIGNARSRKEHSMAEKLSAEMIDTFNNVGSTVKKREDTHKMAESNKAFAHFRW